MRPFLAAAALSAALLTSLPASAFELDSPDPVGGFPGANFNLDVETGPKSGTVLERFADSDDKSKPGTLQVFGNDIGGTYGIPNTIPEPGSSTPNWFYTSPAFRASR